MIPAFTLAYDAVLLLADLSLDSALETLGRARESYGLPLPALSSGELSRWLSGNTPRWYTPSPLYMALTGRRPYKPVRLCPELGYWVGAYLSDGSRCGIANVRDLEFAMNMAAAATAASGWRHGAREARLWDSKQRRRIAVWRVPIGSAALEYLRRSGLYAIVALRYPAEFARGLFDGDGGIYVGVSEKHNAFPYALTLTLSKHEERIADFAEKFMREEFGIKLKRNHVKRDGSIELRACDKGSIRKFHEAIGFSIGWKRELCDDLLRILKLRSNREKIKEWTRTYIKLGNKWVKPRWLNEPKWRWYWRVGGC